jgi:hypothetical protein
MLQFRDTPYVVSEAGEVFRVGKSVPLRPETLAKGYKRVALSIGGKVKRFALHRVVAETYIPNPQNKPYINHIDNNPSNNAVRNLEWCTHSENMLHCHKLGRCSNLLASEAAANRNHEKMRAKFTSLLGSQFIGISWGAGKGCRVQWYCGGCGKICQSRSDSSAFRKPTPKCWSCSMKAKI